LRPFLFACRIVLSEQAFEDLEMARQYLIGSWSNADEYDYSGEQLMGNRLGASREVPHMINGKANLDKYGDNTEKKKPSISIQDRILPQAKRVYTLTNQMRDLVSEYKAGNIDIDEYSMLLSVVSQKRSRAMELLAKAKSLRAPFEIEEEEPISLGKTHVKNEKNFKTSKDTVVEGNRFKGVKKPSNSLSLSKVADWINNHQFTYFVVCSTIALTAAKLVF
jgi:hypothetical protein